MENVSAIYQGDIYRKKKHLSETAMSQQLK